MSTFWTICIIILLMRNLSGIWRILFLRMWSHTWKTSSQFQLFRRRALLKFYSTIFVEIQTLKEGVWTKLCDETSRSCSWWCITIYMECDMSLILNNRINSTPLFPSSAWQMLCAGCQRLDNQLSGIPSSICQAAQSMLCAAWQMLDGMLDNLWQSAQSICQALDRNGGVREIDSFSKQASFKLITLALAPTTLIW